MKPLDELTAHCIRCGFCLESCPTYQLTGEETESPRGRIYLVRSADEGKLAWKDVQPHLDRCLGCRACETACPSGVEYGQIFEIGRDRLEKENSHPAKKAFLSGLTSTKSLRLQLALGRLLPGKKVPALLSKLLSGEPAEANRPQAQPSKTLPKLVQTELPELKGEVFLLEGCVMRVLFPRVHEATRRLLRRIGYAVHEVPQGCCGSLHLHAGYMDQAQLRASSLIDDLRGEVPVIVNSAGCGSTMKEYGALFTDGSAEPSRRELVAKTFASRVVDASEFLLGNGLTDLLRSAQGFEMTATYHDACHLSHGQGVRAQPRELLQAIPRLRLVDLKDADTCCGSAGIYNLTQPKLARELLERKWQNIAATGAQIVAMGNPGCHAWIAQAAAEHGQNVQVLHTAELLEAAFIGLGHFEQK